MGYYNSTIKLRKDGLYTATIRYSYLYFFTSEESETFKTLSEANEWILEKRCPNHTEIEEEDDVEQEEQEEQNCETSPIEGNAFENDSDNESESEDTEQKRNKRLNIEYNRSNVLQDIKKKNRRGKKLRFSAERPASIF